MHNFDTEKIAEFWKTSRRSVQKWAAQGYPVDEPDKMARLIIQWKGGKEATRLVAAKILGDIGSSKGDGDDAAKFPSPEEREEAPPNKVDFDNADAVIDYDKALRYCWTMWQKAANLKPHPDLSGASYWHDRFLKTEEAKRKSEIHAQRMGITDGEIINRETFKSLIFALAFWMCRGGETDMKSLGPHIKRLVASGDSFTLESEVDDIIDRHFMRNRFLGPFAKAVSQESGLSLPKWVLEDLRWSVDVFFEVDPKDKEDVEAYAAFQEVLKEKGK